ncbi:flagellar assembly factor FliW [Halanaerobium congolense]|uniref:Flagellar assembly factor FliW n=2 Tax=Halanaerobium congolense TaxID=54121 RepID=A0A4R7EGK0_9FIRM|nr:flagellar assembly factor FliW [Halanaerobium congolense]
MELMTRDFGKIEIEKDQIINFKGGLPGFEEYQEFVLLPFADDSPFIIMQSIVNPELAFITIEPRNLISDYEFEISDKKEKELKINSIEEILVLNIITLKNKIENITANLSAPIIINLKERLGSQIILDNHKLSVRYPIFAEAEQQSAQLEEVSE